MTTDNLIALARAYVAATDGEAVLAEDRWLRIVAELADRLDATQPAPEPAPAILPASYWLAKFEAAYVDETTRYYHDWSQRPDRVYFCGMLVRANHAIWKAGGGQYRLEEALRIAEQTFATIEGKGSNALIQPVLMAGLSKEEQIAAHAYATLVGIDADPVAVEETLVATTSGVTPIRVALHEFIFARHVAWLLWDMYNDSITLARDYGARFDALLEQLRALWAYWWDLGKGNVKRLVTHILSHSYMVAWALLMIDSADPRAGDYLEVLTWGRDKLDTAYSAAVNRAWEYMIPPEAPRGPVDTAHAWANVELEVWAAGRVGRRAPSLIPFMQAALRQAYNPAVGRWSFCVDGTNTGNTFNQPDRPAPYNWPHVALFGWASLGRTDRAIQALLENYQADSYMALWIAVMAENAAILEAA